MDGKIQRTIETTTYANIYCEIYRGGLNSEIGFWGISRKALILMIAA
jgi:hypothetical protein